MRITRRHFLGVSTGAAALLSTPAAAMGEFGLASHGRNGCLLLDLKSQCVLGESILGYRKILDGVYTANTETLPQVISRYAIIIVPGTGLVDAAVAESLGEALRKGSVILLESGGGYLHPDEFSAHQQMLQRHLNVLVNPPVDLWAHASMRGLLPETGTSSPRKAAANGPAPYIDYFWPHQTKVRDFSRVVPLAAQDGDIIGVAGKLPVAIRKRAGKGTLIFLGSPLGPHLHAGDPEACRWLRSTVAAVCDHGCLN